MKHDEEEIRATLLRAHIRNTIRAERQHLPTKYVSTSSLNAMADSFVKLAASHRPGLPVTFTIYDR